MITLYSYPELFGVADNSGYGLKVFAFFKLTGVSFTHEHILDASAAPRGQLPYIVDDGRTIGDSDTISRTSAGIEIVAWTLIAEPGATVAGTPEGRLVSGSLVPVIQIEASPRL